MLVTGSLFAFSSRKSAKMMNSAKAKNARLPPEVNRVLYVRNLPFNITSEEVSALSSHSTYDFPRALKRQWLPGMKKAHGSKPNPMNLDLYLCFSFVAFSSLA